MKGMLIGLAAVTTAVIIIVDCWATIVVARQTDLPRVQRRLQLVFIWLLPVVGASITLGIHRPDKSYKARSSGTSDDVNPAGMGPKTLVHTQTGRIEQSKASTVEKLTV